jgi:hypothetical protein
MSTYDFEPDPDDYGPEPPHIANPTVFVERVTLNSDPPLPEDFGLEGKYIQRARDYANYLVHMSETKLKAEIEILNKGWRDANMRICKYIENVDRKDAALKVAVMAIEYHTAQTRPIHQTSEALKIIKEAIS